MVEKRFIEQGKSEVRIEENAQKKPEIVGYGAVFYDGTPETEFKLWEDVAERIMPRTFDRAIEEGDDARGLFNHDPNIVLGRRSAKTLTLSVDDTGLLYRAKPPKTTAAADVIENIRAGNLQGSSFAFEVTDQQWRTEDGMDIREITGVKLFDVGPVTFPAYEGTTTAVRSDNDAQEARNAYDAWVKDGKPQPLTGADADPAVAETEAWVKEMAARNEPTG